MAEPYLFYRIRLRDYENMPPEWVLVCGSFWELERAFECIHRRVAVESFKDFMHVSKRSVQRDHYRNATTLAVVRRAENRGQSFVHALSDMVGGMFSNQADLIAQGNVVYIRRCGSYTYEKGDRYDILDRIESEILKFPDSENVPRFMQWPGGKHWYAKYGDEDISVDGQVKWDSRELAESASRKWLKRLKA